MTIGISAPKGGARETRFSATKGFGSLDERRIQRDVVVRPTTSAPSSTAIERDYGQDRQDLVFTNDGKTYRSQNYSASAIPANVLDDRRQPDQPVPHRPPAFARRIRSGSSSPTTMAAAWPMTSAASTYVSTLEIYPETKARHRMASVTAAPATMTSLPTCCGRARARYLADRPGAGSATDPCNVPALRAVPYADGNHGRTRWPSTGSHDLGKREPTTTRPSSSIWRSDPRGVFTGWDYSATLLPLARARSRAASPAIRAGWRWRAPARPPACLNPFVGPGQQTPAAPGGLRRHQLQGLLGRRRRQARYLLQLQGPPARSPSWPAGPMMLALGADYRKSRSSSPSRARLPRASRPTRWTGDPVRPEQSRSCPATSDSATRRPRCLIRPIATPVGLYR